jgi:hypothetical protein
VYLFTVQELEGDCCLLMFVFSTVETRGSVVDSSLNVLKLLVTLVLFELKLSLACLRALQ